MNIPSRRGFTLVELVIVVIVIGILAGIVSVSFAGIQKDARDAKVKAGAQEIAEAIELWSLQTRSQPNTIGVGSGSSGVLQNVNGVQSCTTKGGGSGWLGLPSYACTMEEALVQLGYLDSDYVSSLPKNPKYPTTNGRAYMLYRCTARANHWLLFYSLENPTAKDKQNYTDLVITKCNGAETQRSSYGMESAILMDLTPV